MNYCDRFHWLYDEFDYRYRRPEEHAGQHDVLEFIDQVQEAVGVGQPHMVPGEWPQSIRQLYECTDFHFVGGKIFKKVDPIADAYDGNAGTDILDADQDTLDDLEERLKDNPQAVAFLQEHGQEFVDPVNPEDAMNFAEFGLEDYGVKPEGEIVEAQHQEAEADETELPVLNSIDMVSLNSPFCAFGWRGPRDRYEFRCGRERRNWEEKAHERKVRYGRLLAQVKYQIYDEGTLNQFLWQIRDDYYEDKRLRQQWNRKAFEIDRSIYSDSLRRQGLDEETIRRKLKFGFDNKAFKSPRVIIDGRAGYINGIGPMLGWGKRDSKSCRINAQPMILKDSIWLQHRSAALQECTQTYEQWAKIYKEARVCRERCRNVSSEYPAIQNTEKDEKDYRKFYELSILVNQLKGLDKIDELKCKFEKEELSERRRSQLWCLMNAKVDNLKRDVTARL